MRGYDMKINCLWAPEPTPLENLKRYLLSKGIEEYTIIFDWCIEAEGKYYLIVDELNDEETNQRHEILKVYREKKELESQVLTSTEKPAKAKSKI
jgi:hypothetical protein